MGLADRRQLGRLIAVAVPSLGVATVAIALLQQYVGVPNASAVYLAAVVATAVVAGTWGAIAAAVAAFLLYDFLFIQPVFTFSVADPGEWLNLVLLLFVGIVVGQLLALQRARTEIAVARERESRALFQVSRALATRDSTSAVLPPIAQILRGRASMDRVWLALGSRIEPDRAARARIAARGPAGRGPAGGQPCRAPDAAGDGSRDRPGRRRPGGDSGSAPGRGTGLRAARRVRGRGGPDA